MLLIQAVHLHVHPAVAANVAAVAAVGVSISVSAVAADAAAAAIRAAYAARLPPDSWRLLHDRERLLRRCPHLSHERVRGRRHGA